MSAHLAEIAATVVSVRRRDHPPDHLLILAVLVLDDAGWHGGKGLAVPENSSLLTLPPTPELNPVQNAWQ